VTALDFIITTFWKFCDKHPWDDGDLIIDRVIAECEYNNIDFHKVGRAAFGGRP
jgi:hypothetical protein